MSETALILLIISVGLFILMILLFIICALILSGRIEREDK